MRRRREDAIREFLRCVAEHATVPHWVIEALAPVVRAELRKLEKRVVKKKSRKETRQLIKMSSRWATFTWFKNRGRTGPEALALAAQALGNPDGGDSTIEHGWKETRKLFERTTSARALPPQRGVVDDDLTDFAGVPEAHVLKARLDTYLAFKDHGCTRDAALAHTAQALRKSCVNALNEQAITAVLKKYRASRPVPRPA